MIVCRKFFGLLNTLTDIIVLLVSIVMLLIGMYSIYDSYLVYMGANDDSLLKYKPGYGQDEEDNREILPNMVAWLTVEDVSIDYPVMQGNDNIEFLNKNPFGDYSLSGSIFVDSRNTKDFSDKYNILYGHHMEGGGMFGVLDEYYKEGFLEQHNKGTLTVDDKVYKIRLFAIFQTDATNDVVFSVETPVEKIYEYAKKNSEHIDDSYVFKKTDKLIALSTCRYPDTTERTVVLGVI